IRRLTLRRNLVQDMKMLGLVPLNQPAIFQRTLHPRWQAILNQLSLDPTQLPSPEFSTKSVSVNGPRWNGTPLSLGTYGTRSEAHYHSLWMADSAVINLAR